MLELDISSIIVDPSAASFKVECERRGLILDDADNFAVEGIRHTASLLNNQRLFVSSSCNKIREEFASYV